MGTLIRYTKINNSKAWQPLALEKPFKYIYVIIQSKKKYGKYFSSFSNFLWNIFPKALAQGNIQRKLEKREKYTIFFEWMYIKIIIINVQNIWDKTFNSRSQQRSKQKGWTKKVEELPWEFSDFELTANQIARKICSLQICEIFRVH